MRILLILILLMGSLNAGNKVALLIGNQNYENYPKLNTPVNDVRAMNDLLKNMGFETIILTNATQERIEQTLYNFENKASKSEIALVYYSGHGIAINDKNYLIPVNASIVNKQFYKLMKLISLNEIIASASHAKTSIILLDMGKSTSYLPPKFQKGLAPISLKENPNLIVCFSTATGKTSSNLEINQKNSPYAKALLKNLDKNFEIRETLQNTRKDIIEETNFQQIPYIFNNLGSDKIYLKQFHIYSTSLPKPVDEGKVAKENPPISSCTKYHVAGGLDPHICISEHSHIYITYKDEIKQLKNMKTFVLFPDNLTSFTYQNSKEFKRYKRILELIQKTQEYTLQEINSNENAKKINQFILFGGLISTILDEPITPKNYNYKLSNQIISIIENNSTLSFKGEGPFLVTTMDNIITDKNITYLYVDLSPFNNSAIDEIINSYKEHLEDKGNSEFTTLEKLKHKILALITNANEHIRIVKTAVAGDLE